VVDDGIGHTTLYLRSQSLVMLCIFSLIMASTPRMFTTIYTGLYLYI
jgi:hypothetical protein